MSNRDYADGQAPGVTIVDTVTTEIVPANNRRNWVVLTNIGDNDVYFAYGKPAEKSKGQILYANGGNSFIGGEWRTSQAINGVTLEGTSKVIFQEAI